MAYVRRVAIRVADDDLTWHRTRVQDRPAAYARGGGDGPPVVFLHGWALGSRAYKRAMRRLTSRGCRVYAPSMPSFGGTADLPAQSMDLAAYADWVVDFMAEVDIGEPALLIGHSFGGGVATTLAHARPELVRYLVLLNAVGGVTARSPWSWAVGFARELWPVPQGVEMALAMRDDLVTNLIRNPIGLLRAGRLAQEANLTRELAEVRAAGVPVLVLTSEGDEVIPRAAFEALCGAIGAEGRVVPGRHSWLLAEPDRFSDVLANIVEVQVAEHRERSSLGVAAEVAELLSGSGVPRRTASKLLASAPPLWLLSDVPGALAGDLALCHPKLRRDEVRAVARPIEGGGVRLTVVAPDRSGLLADSAAVMAWHRLAITSASASRWNEALTVHALTISPPSVFDDDAWTALGEDLRAMVAAGATTTPPFRPIGQAEVAVHGESDDRSLVRVRARDQLGLFAAICRWFASHELSIESVHATTRGGIAVDTFVVDGRCDGDELARHLSR